MRNPWMLFIGIVIVVAGGLALIGTLFRIDTGAWCWPLGLIAVGAFLLLRPRFVSPDTAMHQRLLGDIRLGGAWQVRDEEMWIGVGDVKLDLTAADIPAGETRLRIYAFVADVDVIVPQAVGLSVTSAGVVGSNKLWGQKRDTFLAPVSAETENYAAAERRLRLEVSAFVADVKVVRV